MKYIKAMKIVGMLLVVSLSLGGCQQQTRVKALEQSPYFVVDQANFDRFVLGKADAFASYNGIIFNELNFDQFKLQASRDKEVDNTWRDLSDEDKAVFAAYLQSEIEQVFTMDSGQAIKRVSEKGPGVIWAEVRLLELTPKVAKHGANISGTVGDSYIESLGSLVIQIVLADAQTGEFLAVIEDGRDLAQVSQNKPKVNRATQAYIWRRTFNIWMQRLQDSLIELQQEDSLVSHTGNSTSGN